jgi:hypothetical protein
VYGNFFFSEPTVTGISYLDILENYFLPQIEQYMDRDLIFQQDGAPPSALSLRVYFLPQLAGVCLDWT